MESGVTDGIGAGKVRGAPHRAQAPLSMFLQTRKTRVPLLPASFDENLLTPCTVRPHFAPSPGRSIVYHPAFHLSFSKLLHMANYDLIVIGGRPGRIRRRNQGRALGKKVACIEKERAGGTCLNWGCIPRNRCCAMPSCITSWHIRAEEFGFAFEKLTFDWSKIVQAVARRSRQERRRRRVSLQEAQDRLHPRRGDHREGGLCEGEAGRRQGGSAQRAEAPRGHGRPAADRCRGWRLTANA